VTITPEAKVHRKKWAIEKSGYSQFSYIEVIVPTYAMSAGTMISLASNKIIMGRQSQLGPIDPQMPIGGRYVSAQSIVDQFEKAKEEISADPKVANVMVSNPSNHRPCSFARGSECT